jgi:hypothetical protein
MAIWLVALFIEPDVLKNQSLGSRLHAIVITVVVVAALDMWFSRRMGLTIDARGITLHYAFHRKRVSWASVEGFEWRRWNSPRSEWIWIRVTGGNVIRIPTIQRSPGGEKHSILYRLLASDKIRTGRGAFVDAMATLQHAQATSQRELEGSQGSVTMPGATYTVPPT